MGLLTEGDPTAVRRKNGPGQKFVDLFWTLDADDQEKIRRWSKQYGGVMFIYRKLSEHFAIGYTTVERGLARLEASEWES